MSGFFSQGQQNVQHGRGEGKQIGGMWGGWLSHGRYDYIVKRLIISYGDIIADVLMVYKRVYEDGADRLMAEGYTYSVWKLSSAFTLN